MYWLTGNPRLPTGTDQYPMYGSVVSKLRPGPADLPTFATLGKIDHHIGNAIAGSFLGPAHNPFIFDPTQSKDDLAKMLTPQVELPSFERNADLLKAVDQRLRRQDALDPIIEGMDQYQQTAFNLLRSPKLRQALDLSKEPAKTLNRYTAKAPAKVDYTNHGNVLHFPLARRLIEAGVPVVHFSFGYWDWHGGNFKSGRVSIPHFDAALSALLEDLDQRGLLKTTIVLALGEMGRMPKCGTKEGAGRDHWDYAQFVLAAGGGFKGGNVVGATDKKAEHVVDKFYKVESFGEDAVPPARHRPRADGLHAEPAAGEADCGGRAAHQGGAGVTSPTAGLPRLTGRGSRCVGWLQFDFRRLEFDYVVDVPVHAEPVSAPSFVADPAAILNNLSCDTSNAVEKRNPIADSKARGSFPGFTHITTPIITVIFYS